MRSAAIAKWPHKTFRTLVMVRAVADLVWPARQSTGMQQVELLRDAVMGPSCVGVPTSLCNTNRAEAARLEPSLGLLGPWGVTDKRSFALACRQFALWCWCHSRRADANCHARQPIDTKQRRALEPGTQPLPAPNSAAVAPPSVPPPSARRIAVQLTAGDPDAAVRVSSACDLVTSKTAIWSHTKKKNGTSWTRTNRHNASDVRCEGGVAPCALGAVGS